MTLELAAKIKAEYPPIIEDIVSSSDFVASESQREAMKKFYQSNNIEKFNLGSVQLWENDCILFVTPFGYIDSIDIIKEKKIGSINNNTIIINKNEGKNEGTIIYNISQIIKDP